MTEIAPPHADSRPRLQHIDALRGIAAMLVLLQHLITAMALHPKTPKVLCNLVHLLNHELLQMGRVGVVIFFLISGYVIPFSFKHKNPVKSFLLSRALRLYPAYWLSILVTIVALVLTSAPLPPVSTVLANTTMVQLIFHKADINPAYWTLFLELVFYAMCLTWFKMGRLGSAKFISSIIAILFSLALAAAIIRSFGSIRSIPVGYITFLATMHMGCLARMALINKDRFARWVLPRLAISVLILEWIIAWLTYRDAPEIDSWISASFSMGIGYAAFFYCAVRANLHRPTTIYLGAISYSLYLLHDAPLQVAKFLAPGISNWLFAEIVTALLVISVSVLLATVSYYAIELPAMALRRRSQR